MGFKWSIASDASGSPIGWAIDGANRHDIRLLGPTLDTVTVRGLHLDIETLHLDRGYDAPPCAPTWPAEITVEHADTPVLPGNSPPAG